MPRINDVFSALPLPSFRGIEFPISSWDASHSHNNIKHGLQYRDKKLVETTGADNLVFSYTIPFRQGITKGPYRDLFLKTFPEFFDAYLDKSRGELQDPIFGIYHVKPGDIKVGADPNRRDGVECQITFIEDPDINETGERPRNLSIAFVVGQAKRLDDAVSLTDYEQEEPPQPSTDPLSAISGVGAQLNRAPGKVSAKLHDTAFRAKEIETETDKLQDPENNARTVREARDLQVTALRLEEKAINPTITEKKTKLTVDTSITRLAARYGMGLDSFLALNPGLNGKTIAPAGYTVRYRESGRVDNAAGLGGL